VDATSSESRMTDRAAANHQAHLEETAAVYEHPCPRRGAASLTPGTK
jgi:hypothetical protein